MWFRQQRPTKKQMEESTNSQPIQSAVKNIIKCIKKKVKKNFIYCLELNH